MGCGTGKYTKMLSPYSEKWYANDISPLMIEKTKDKCAHLHNITYIASSAENTQIPNESIDLIFAAWAYTAAEGREITLRIEKEFDRILKSDGSIWLLENYLEGEFTDMRGITLPQDAPRYISHEYGYELVSVVPVYFKFHDLDEAKKVCGYIFGDHAIRFFDKKGVPTMEDMVSVLTKRKQV